jgi:hypothetical protein
MKTLEKSDGNQTTEKKNRIASQRETSGGSLVRDSDNHFTSKSQHPRVSFNLNDLQIQGSSSGNIKQGGAGATQRSRDDISITSPSLTFSPPN